LRANPHFDKPKKSWLEYAYGAAEALALAMGGQRMKLTDEMKAELEAVAEVLKKFPESLQGKVLDLIIQGTKVAAPALQPGSGRRANAKRASPRVTKSSGGSADINKLVPKRILDLDLGHKSDPESFGSFVESKKPNTNFEFNAVAIFYLAEKKKIDPITVNHVYTCYDDVERPIPEALVQSIRDTASKKGYVDVSDWHKLRLATKGKNLVSHDLPRKAAPK
jgi:hypothetical protein